MDTELHAQWQEVLSLMRKEMNEANYNTWMSILQPLSLRDQVLTIHVPNQFSRQIVEGVHSRSIEDAVKEVMGREVELVFTDPSEKTTAPQPQMEPEKNPHRRQNLVPRFTFEHFVVGANNQLPYASAQAVAKHPGEIYNPLFIYGDVGLGKTHLMHAIGNYILDYHKDLNVLYLTFEQFLNQFIDAIKKGESQVFRETYRNADVLLIDDIQFIAGKEQTQEEFHHTFNDLMFADKQIVISSDRPPKEIKTLAERLRSRLSSGLIVEIGTPELETRMAILRKKAEMEAVPVPDEVITYIAEHVTSNIRELEGALIRTVAFSVLTNQPLTEEMAKQALQNIVTEQKKAITIPNILDIVSDFYQVTPEDIVGKKRIKNVVLPRQVAIYITRNLTDLSLPKIGQEFGGRDHTTILYSITKVEELLEGDPLLKHDIEELIHRIRG